ncbi:MAG TPA: RDD family protein [Actinomycetota bacterium]|nr:RDD family protein [Actinomycetota bacterium]
MVEPAKHEGPDRRSESSRSEGSRGRIEAPAPPVEEGRYKRPSGPRAGFWVRFDALLIDLVLLAAVTGTFLGIGSSSLSSWVKVSVDPRALLLLIAYFSFFEGSVSGQTVGKKLLNIRVVDLGNGQSIGFVRAAVRNVVAYFVSVIFLLGYLWMIWDEEKQTWHDKVASSVVVPTDAFPVDKWPG